MIGKSSVFLVGPMGSGKTAVGRHLARVLQLPFHDSDAETRLSHLMDARAPLYSEVADIVVTTDGRRVNSVAEQVLQQLAAARRPRPR